MNSGFTLIEIMIAIAFFSIVSMSIFSLVLHTAGVNIRAKKMVRANVVAASQVELYKSLPIDDPCFAQTETPDEIFVGPFRLETIITDDTPLAKSPEAGGAMQTVSKLIQITVFPDNTETRNNKKDQAYLARLHFIKTRSH